MRCLAALAAEPLPLEELARRTRVPKASLLRLLETLIALGLVTRIEPEKRYRALAAVLPLAHPEAAFRQRLRAVLAELAASTGQTAEWYLPRGGKMLLVDREQPADRVVQVRAALGFVRELAGELEAVARLALAAGVAPAAATYWQYRAGQPAPLSRPELTAALAAAAGGRTRDREYNPNGVRRYAAAVRQPDGTLAGILALAESFTPDAEREAAARLKILGRQAAALTAALTPLTIPPTQE